MLKVGVEPGGLSVTAQVYTSAASPSSLAPSTLRADVVPMTRPGVACAAVATVGADGLTVTLACPLTAPLVAVTVTLPVLAGDVNKPSASIDPAEAPQLIVT